MRYLLLGRSGLRVSEICLGTMTFGEDWGWGASREASRAMFDAFAAAGGNFIDTSSNYTNGTAERFVGEFIAADRFTIAGLGKEVATGVGVDYDRVVLIGTGLIALAAGVVTVVVGNLPFLGLIVPNVVSLIRGDDLRSNLPWVALGGIALVTACDIVARVINMPFEVPVSLILAMIGSVVFILLLLRQRRLA